MSSSGTSLKEHIIFQKDTRSSHASLDFTGKGMAEINDHGDTSVSNFVSDNIVVKSFTGTTTRKFIFFCIKIIFEEVVKTSLRLLIKYREDIYKVFKNLIL